MMSFDQALAIEPNNVEALGNKGAALISLGRSEKLFRYLIKYLDIDPINVSALGNKGVALKSLGKS